MPCSHLGKPKKPGRKGGRGGGSRSDEMQTTTHSLARLPQTWRKQLRWRACPNQRGARRALGRRRPARGWAPAGPGSSLSRPGLWLPGRQRPRCNHGLICGVSARLRRPRTSTPIPNQQTCTHPPPRQARTGHNLARGLHDTAGHSDRLAEEHCWPSQPSVGCLRPSEVGPCLTS